METCFPRNMQVGVLKKKNCSFLNTIPKNSPRNKGLLIITMMSMFSKTESYISCFMLNVKIFFSCKNSLKIEWKTVSQFSQRLITTALCYAWQVVTKSLLQSWWMFLLYKPIKCSLLPFVTIWSYKMPINMKTKCNI